MPCTKCKDENYKWGKTGSCKYATKEECERANPKKYNKMNPTPLGKKSYEEYAKELKEMNLSEVERVELSSVEELKKQIKGMKSALDYVDKRIVEGDKYIKELIKYRNFSLNVYSKLIKLKPKMQEVAQDKLDKFEKLAKDLGLSIDRVPEVREIKELISETKKQMKETKDLIKRFEQQGLK
tara:strand:+ start:510 stop:1055 length:546 start_codon:yes stop_codon:yes gene_type:complete